MAGKIGLGGFVVHRMGEEGEVDILMMVECESSVLSLCDRCTNTCARTNTQEHKRDTQERKRDTQEHKTLAHARAHTRPVHLAYVYIRHKQMHTCTDTPEHQHTKAHAHAHASDLWNALRVTFGKVSRE